jgi:MoaA/NifB/PqqE/SkfB family radical SAM enzyme
MRKSYLTVLVNEVRKGHLGWPVRQALKWPAIRLGSAIGRPLAGPVHGTFFTTYACNLRCQFCDLPYRHLEYTKAGKAALDRAEKLAIVDDFAAIGTTAIGFTGGEPMLDPDTPALIARALERGMLTHLSTNGYAARTSAGARALFDLGVHGVSLSIDAATAALHDRLRGAAGSHAEVIGALHHLLAARRGHPNRMSITTTTVITRDNFREVPALVDLLLELGVDQIGFMPVSELGLDYDVARRSGAFLATAADVAELDAVVDYLVAAKRRTGRIENTEAYLALFRDAFRGRPLPIHCRAGYVTLAVDSWGDIYPCFPWAEMRRAAGNVRTAGLAAFWRSDAAAAMRDEAAGCRDCYWNNHTELNLMLDGRRREVDGYVRTAFSRDVPASVVRHLGRREQR